MLDLASDTPHVYLVDDQPQVIKALARVLDANGYDAVQFTSPHAFLAGAHAMQPGCLVLDLAMPEMGGMALQQALTARGSLLPLIFLTGHGDMASGVTAMKLGAFDFLSKPVDTKRFLAVVVAALAHNVAARAARAHHQHAVRLIATLSPREREVLALIVEGKLNKQVAFQLGTAEKTVKAQRVSVMLRPASTVLPHWRGFGMPPNRIDIRNDAMSIL